MKNRRHHFRVDLEVHATVYARVVRSGEKADTDGYLWALQFEALDMPTRSALSRFVFAQAKQPARPPT